MDNYLEATNYVHRGSMMVLRSALPLDDSESWVQLWIKKFGDLSEFPWENVYGEVPTKLDLLRGGLIKCPLCGQRLDSHA